MDSEKDTLLATKLKGDFVMEGRDLEDEKQEFKFGAKEKPESNDDFFDDYSNSDINKKD